MSDLESLRNMLVCAKFHAAQTAKYLADLEERISVVERAQSEAKPSAEPVGLYASRHSVYVLRDSAECLYRLRDGCWQVRFPGSTEWTQSEYGSKQRMLDLGHRLDLAPDPEELWIDLTGTLYRDYYGEWQRMNCDGQWERSAYSSKQDWDDDHS